MSSPAPLSSLMYATTSEMQCPRGGETLNISPLFLSCVCVCYCREHYVHSWTFLLLIFFMRNPENNRVNVDDLITDADYLILIHWACSVGIIDVQGWESYADLRKYAVLVPKISEFIAFSLSPCGMMILTPIGFKIIIPQGRETTPALEFAKIRGFCPQPFSSLMYSSTACSLHWYYWNHFVTFLHFCIQYFLPYLHCIFSETEYQDVLAHFSTLLPNLVHILLFLFYSLTDPWYEIQCSTAPYLPQSSCKIDLFLILLVLVFRSSFFEGLKKYYRSI
jgi:hypothetical protein